MKPYIMQYSETAYISGKDDPITDSTRKTFSIESNDEDYLNLSGWTTITKVSEPSDEDSIGITLYHSTSKEFKTHPSTMITETIENDDNDYLNLSTIKTNTIESSDEDYIFNY